MIAFQPGDLQRFSYNSRPKMTPVAASGWEELDLHHARKPYTPRQGNSRVTAEISYSFCMFVLCSFSLLYCVGSICLFSINFSSNSILSQNFLIFLMSIVIVKSIRYKKYNHFWHSQRHMDTNKTYISHTLSPLIFCNSFSNYMQYKLFYNDHI